MAQHVIRYFDADANAVRERRLDAVSLDAARTAVEADGGVVIEARRAAVPLWPGAAWKGQRRRIPAAEVALICNELRAMLLAGLSVVEAIEALSAAKEGRGSASGVHRALLERLRHGRSLSASMGDVGGFPALLVACVQGGERTSNLLEALDSYLRYDETVGALRRRVISAALYPGIVVSLGTLVAIFLLMVVIPRFATLYGEMRGAAGDATLVLIRVSLTLKEHPWLVPAGLGVLAACVAALWWREHWRRVAGWVVGEWPWLEERLSDFGKARVYEALALLVRGGYTLHEALGMCAGVATDAAGRARIAEARQAIERGANVSAAFAAAGLTDAVTERLLRAAERGGDFHRVLKAIGDRHAHAFETFVDRATRIVEPLLLLGVALLVGGMVVLLYMPVFDIAASVR